MIDLPKDFQQLTAEQVLEVLQFYLETVVSECQAFNHSQFIYPLYQTFQFELNKQIRQLPQSHNAYESFKQLQQKATNDQTIIEMLNEYDEFVHPIKIQVLPKLKNNHAKLPQKQKKAASCILETTEKYTDISMTASHSMLVNQTHRDSRVVVSEEQLFEPKMQIITEFDEKSYISEINFQKNPQMDLKEVLQQRMEQSKNYYYEEAQLDDAYYVIQQAKEDAMQNQEIAEWFSDTYRSYIELIENRVQTMKTNLGELESNDFIIEKNSKTLLVKYKLDPTKAASVTLFMDSVFEANITKLMALIIEINLYHHYVPFCTKSQMVKSMGKTSRICEIELYFPLVSDRKAVFIGEGIDRLNINGTILFVCKSVDQDEEFLKQNDINLSQDKNKFVSLDLNYYVFELTPLSQDKCRVRAVTNTDPKFKFLPKALVALVARKMGSTLFEKMQKITKNFERSPWYPKYLENKDFYDWIDKKVKAHLDKQQNKTN